MPKKQLKQKEGKKHRHKIKTIEQCPICGAMIGYCKGCDESFVKEGYKGARWEEIL